MFPTLRQVQGRQCGAAALGGTQNFRAFLEAWLRVFPTPWHCPHPPVVATAGSVETHTQATQTVGTPLAEQC